MTYVRSKARPSTVAEPRINARLDTQACAQLAYLTATTGLGISEVVRMSLAHYYRAQRTAQTPALKHLMPLVGRFRSGQADTSERVKQVVAEHIAAKLGTATKADESVKRATPRRESLR